jgi:DNA-binding transcriptional regulator YiaG
MRRIVLPDEVDVKRIRTKARMSQAEFARAFALIQERCRNGSKDGESPTRPPAHT